MSIRLSVSLYLLTCVVVHAGAEDTTAVTRRGTNHDIRFTTALTPRSDILLGRRHTTLHKATGPTLTYVHFNTCVISRFTNHNVRITPLHTDINHSRVGSSFFRIFEYPSKPNLHSVVQEYIRDKSVQLRILVCITTFSKMT